MFQAVPPPIIRSSKLYTQHWVFVELFLLLTAIMCAFQRTHGSTLYVLQLYTLWCSKQSTNTLLLCTQLTTPSTSACSVIPSSGPVTWTLPLQTTGRDLPLAPVPTLVPIQSPMRWGNGGYFPGDKTAAAWGSSSSAEVNSECSCASTASTCLHGEHGDNCSLHS